MDQAGAVDSEVQGSISNLVSALGGVDLSTQEYKLGDEALACLRDLKKWLQNYDAKYERLEVSCAIANTTLIVFDIPQILGSWESSWRKKSDPYLDRVALACLELLVPLTWPLEIVGKEATAEHFSQSIFLKQAQDKYKRALLTHKSHGILRAAIRLAAPSLRVPYKNREQRDEGILTLSCSFFRNILAMDAGNDESRALAIRECECQKVLSFLVTLGAGMGTAMDSHFDAQDTLVQECLYLILRGVDVYRLHKLEPRSDSLIDSYNQNLKQMLETETEMNRSAFKPTRHSRFGTMIAMNEGGGNQVSISGQRGVSGSIGSTLVKLDEGKKWRRPNLRGALDELEKASFMPALAAINTDAEIMVILRKFVADFLDSSFNPLFVKIRNAIERQQSPRVSSKTTLMQYLYLIGWFIEAEQMRAESENRKMDFKLIGGSLSKASFALVINLLRRGMEPGEMRSTDLVHAAMTCIRQILTTVRKMGYDSVDEELRDIAEGMKARLFYKESWLQLFSQLPRSSHRRSLAYACESIACTHIVLKMLEEYSKQHTVMFVRMKQRRKRRQTQQRIASSNAEDNSINEGSDTETERSHRESIRVSSERKFSFQKYVLKYINGPTIDTYERVLAAYKELSDETILQILSFFRKTFAKTKSRALFYRMSLMRLLLDLVDVRGLPRDSKSYEVTDQFLKYYVQKFVETSKQMPSLHIQINKSISPGDAFYYDHGGREKEKFKPPKYEFSFTDKAKRELDSERQAAVLVAGLIDIGKENYLRWIEDALTNYLGRDKAQRKLQRALTLDKDKIKAVHNDALLRLLLRTLGLIVNTTVGEIAIPCGIDELALIEHLEWIRKYQNEAVEFEGGKMAIDYIKIEGEEDKIESHGIDGRSPTERFSFSHNKATEQFFSRKSSEKPFSGLSAAVSKSYTQVPNFAPEANDTEVSDAEDESIFVSPYGKRKHLEAFSLAPSDDENHEALSQSIAAIRRKKQIDDEDGD